MSQRERTPTITPAPGNGQPPQLALVETPPPRRLRIKRLRLIALLAGLCVLAAISTLFGMMMAVASDLPEIDVLDVPTRQTHIVDRNGRDLGVLTGDENRLLVSGAQIAPVMKHAVVAIEDRRFYTNSGVDLRGIARAFVQDILHKHAVQGASTIAEQLVKNRLEAEGNRTIFEKMREAAMAFHMTRKWDKDRILRNYLNTIYFGNGAYGIEAAARTYFGTDFGLGGPDPQCGSAPGQRRCAELLSPAQAAMIAGVIASPSAFDPVAHPVAARQRRNLVLLRMLQQRYITRLQYRDAVSESLPTASDVRPPQVTSKYPYFTTWVRQQVVDRVGAGKAFEGGLRIKTTIDSQLQQEAQSAITQWLGPHPGTGGVPAAALVALDNRTSQVLAMVGGNDATFNSRPFNLATQGQRQPGSSIKPFILARALEEGYSANSVFSSRRKVFCVTYRHGKCVEHFVVNNFANAYSGVTTLGNATAFSDNSVFAELGLKVGTKSIAHLAEHMGIRTPVSSNDAMTLGGLRQGVTPLDMAHAYESFASGGNLVWGTMSPGADEFRHRHDHGTVPGPVGIQEILQPKGSSTTQYKPADQLDGHPAVDRTRTHRVLPAAVASGVQSMLQNVVRIGTGKRAAQGSTVMVAGKTGTTENYGDAWFVGWTPRYTVAVWVGYPNSVRAMKPPTFSFNGEAVEGGTYPAAIWGSFMHSAIATYLLRHPGHEGDFYPPGVATPSPVTGAPAVPTTTAPSTSATTTPSTPSTPATPAPTQAPAPAQPAPQATPPPAAPTPAPTAAGGTGGAAPTPAP